MKVILNAIDPIKVTAFVSYYTCNVGIKLIDLILLNGWLIVLCMENKVIQMLTITGHFLNYYVIAKES